MEQTIINSNRTTRGTNLEHVATYNQAVILDVIRRTPGGVSRVELTQQSGLSAQTVSNIVRKLITEGIVAEGNKTSTEGPGKPRTVLKLNGTSAYSAGIHLDPGQVTIALLDFTGTLVAGKVIPLPEENDPENTLTMIARQLRELSAHAGVPWDRLIGVGLATPGPIDRDHGIMLTPPLLPRWRSTSVVEVLRQQLNLPVLLEKDVSALAAAELWVAGPEHLGDCAVLYLGAGVGVGLTSRRRPILGAHQNAGEVGSLLVGVTETGQPVTLSDATSPERIIATAITTGALPANTPRNNWVELLAAHETLGARTAAGDAAGIAARSILDRLNRDLLTAIGTITNLLDLERVVLSGPFWQTVKSYCLPRLSENLNDVLAHPDTQRVRIQDSRWGEHEGAIGAACVALDRMHSPTLEQLLSLGAHAPRD